jgi:hypothetical protein
VTIDEELSKLEDDIRRLKIEYEIYLNGSSDRPPRDSVYRVESVVKRLTGDAGNLSFGQRFKLNSLAQKYAVQGALWRRKLMEKEGGRGQFAQQRRGLEALTEEKVVRVVCADPAAEPEKAEEILRALLAAQRRVGQAVSNVEAERFRKYLCGKTEQLRVWLRCDKVQFSVGTAQGRVKFWAAKG